MVKRDVLQESNVRERNLDITVTNVVWYRLPFWSRTTVYISPFCDLILTAVFSILPFVILKPKDTSMLIFCNNRGIEIFFLRNKLTMCSSIVNYIYICWIRIALWSLGSNRVHFLVLGFGWATSWGHIFLLWRWEYTGLSCLLVA